MDLLDVLVARHDDNAGRVNSQKFLLLIPDMISVLCSYIPRNLTILGHFSGFVPRRINILYTFPKRQSPTTSLTWDVLPVGG